MSDKLTPNEDRNAAWAAGLHELADWYNSHPEIDPPTITLTNYNYDTKEEAVHVLKALKPCKKRYYEDSFYLSREFGPITHEFMFYRRSVCTPRVVGVETVPARFIPAQTIEARTVEKVEWDCHPLLNEAEEQKEQVAESGDEEPL